MENFYKKVIYDITQLILNKNYKRAITLGQFLLNKGFKTNELIVIISYAHKLLYGPKQAIEFLQKHQSSQKYNHQGNQSQEIKSPLMQLAYAEYRIENQKRNLALQNIKQLIKITDDLPSKNEENRLYLLLNTLHKNYLPVDENLNDKKYQQEQDTNIYKNEVSLLMKQINHLTQTYFQQRDQFMKQNKFQISETALKYGHFYIQYNQFKRKILTLLTEQVKKDSLHTVNKRIKRKQNKFLKDTQEKNIKKIQIKQINGKETNQQIPTQNYQTLQGTNEKFISKTNQREQFIIPMNQIEQLQSLLSHVNGFISFFKNKLKDYGASRVKEFQFENQQTQEQNENKI